MTEWTFLTNHLHVLYCVASHPGIRILEIAECVGVRERAAHRLVTDLVEGGYLTRSRVGTRNFYELHPTLPLRREGLGEVAIGEILAVLLRSASDAAPSWRSATSGHRGGDDRATDDENRQRGAMAQPSRGVTATDKASSRRTEPPEATSRA